MNSLRDIVDSSPHLRVIETQAMYRAQGHDAAKPLAPARWDWQQARKILLVRLRSIGDTVLATPSAFALKRFLPHAEVDILVEDWVAPLLNNHPHIDNVIELERGGMMARARVARELRSANYDVVYNLHGGTTATFLTRATGAPHRVGFKTYQYAQLHTHQAPSPLLLWGRLSSLHARLTTGDASAPSIEKLQWVENASAEIERMQQATIVCAHCPACLPMDAAGEGESVGCLGRINYPVEAQFEKFLADRVQLSLDTLDKEDQPRLLRILIDPESPFDGEATKELRRVVTDEGLRFFELRVPIVLTREAARLSTDNIFDLLAGFRSEDSDKTTYTRELPYEAAADYYDFLDLILRSELSQSEVARLTSRSRNYNQFLRLLIAIEKAEALNARVLID